jgi:hypothetical protein
MLNGIGAMLLFVKGKKVELTLEQATKAQKGSRGIALFLI